MPHAISQAENSFVEATTGFKTDLFVGVDLALKKGEIFDFNERLLYIIAYCVSNSYNRHEQCHPQHERGTQG